MAQPEDEKVKVVYFNDPKKYRFVTRAAVKMLSPKWVEAEDQTGAPNPNGQKKADAAPVASTIDRKAELREKYNELTGDQAKPEWNEARLFVEISKAEKAKPAEPAAEAEQPKQEAVEPAPKVKKAKKAVEV